MLKPKSKPEFNIILAVNNSDDAQILTNLLTHIRWPIETVVQKLAFVPDRLPEMDPDPERQIDEAVALERWRNWAAAKILSSEMAVKLRAHHLAVTIEICEGQLPEVAVCRVGASGRDPEPTPVGTVRVGRLLPELKREGATRPKPHRRRYKSYLRLGHSILHRRP